MPVPADSALFIIVTSILGLISLVAILLFIRQRRQATRHLAQTHQLVRLLEKALHQKSAHALEHSAFNSELAPLIAPINQLLETQSDPVHGRYQVLKELARGLNHNMNNLLFGILGATQLIERHSDDPEIKSWAKVAYTDGQKLTDLVKQLTEAVTEHIDQTPDDVNLNAAITVVLNNNQPRWLESAASKNQHIRFQTDLADHCAHIRANRGAITQMITHLVQNAVDALSNTDKGTITLRTFQPNPLEVAVEIHDDGVGMDGDTRRRNFDPFFTTKKTLGTGLGLSTVMTTVLQWDGTMSVTSEPGAGASFVATFPAINAPLPGEQSVDPTTRHTRVLVVDDQPAIGAVIANALNDNFVATVFEDAESAIRAFQPGHWQVAIIDLDLPGTPGDQLANRLREHDPNIIRILMTGWALDSNDPRRESFEHYLQKPVIDLDQLNKLISSALRDHKPAGL